MPFTHLLTKQPHTSLSGSHPFPSLIWTLRRASSPIESWVTCRQGARLARSCRQGLRTTVPRSRSEKRFLIKTLFSYHLMSISIHRSRSGWERVKSKKIILKLLSPIPNGAFSCVCRKSTSSSLRGACPCPAELALTSAGGGTLPDPGVTTQTHVTTSCNRNEIGNTSGRNPSQNKPAEHSFLLSTGGVPGDSTTDVIRN